MLVKANAKINLTLDIAGKKENGYHILDSVFQSVSLCDIINIEKSDTLTVKFNNKNVCAEESIAYKCAKAFFDYSKINTYAKISIENHIPLGSGMGGGSADSAGVLVGLNALFGSPLSTKELINIGASIGADIPFCIVGGTARVGGIGEIITPLKAINSIPTVIIKDKEKQSTALMYSKLDKQASYEKNTENMVKAIKENDICGIYNNISNAFNSVFEAESEKKLLLNSGAKAVGLSGSGPSVFGFFENEEQAKIAFDALKDEHNVYLCTTADKGIIID